MSPQKTGFRSAWLRCDFWRIVASSDMLDDIKGHLQSRVGSKAILSDFALVAYLDADAS